MSQARTGAACIALPDGRVLVSGGNDGKANLASAEVYDAKKDAWQSVGEMSVARSGHTATATPWGAILLTGGEETGAVEMFLLNDTFQPLGMLATGRTDHAIAATYDHKVIIAGGSHGGTALSTVEIYDGDTGKLIPGGKMLAARRNFSAAPLVDGTILLTGGYGANGAILNTTEIFDPQKGESVAGPTMSSARANHKSTVLPSNGRVLIVGGTDENGVTSTNELYTPWTRKFGTVPPMHSARQQMAVAPLRRGAIVVAGGKGENGSLSGSEVFGYATVDTDKADYAPGEQATFNGTGWKPGEQVLLQVSAFPLDQHSVEYTAVTQADSTGRIKITPFNIDRSHLGVRFLATATGSESQAQNTFTDGEAALVTMTLTAPVNPFGTAVTPSGHVAGVATNPVTAGNVAISIDGLAAYSTVAVNTGDFTGASISNLVPGNHFFIASYTGGGAIWNDSVSSAVTYTVTTPTTTAINNPTGSAVLGTAVLFKATVSSTLGAAAPTTGTINFVNTSTGNSVVATAQVGSGGIAQTTTTTLPSNNALAYSFAAIYVPTATSGYGTSTSSNTSYIVTKSPAAVTVSTSPVSPTVGQQVGITGCVTPVPGFTPTGTLRFRDNGVDISNDIQMSGGCATIQYSLMVGGTNNIAAIYLADSNYNNGSNLGSPLAVTVAKATTTSAVTSNPVTSVAFGTPITLVGTVTSSATAVTGFLIGGAGNATFKDGGIAVACTTPQPLAVVNGSVSCILSSNLAVGSHAITLDYGSGGVSTDVNFAASVSPTYNLVIANASTVTTLSANQSSIALGSSVTYTASVQGSPAASGNPTGSVTFFDGGSTPICSTVAVTVANPAVAVCTKTYDASLPVYASGTHQITAVYSATGTFTGSTSNAVTLTVTKPQATVGSLTVTPNASPITYNTADTVRASFSPSAGGPALTGTVTFFDGANPIGSTAVVSGGNTDLALPNSVIQSVGTHALTAQYGGDSNYAASVAPFPVTSLVVNKATPTLTPTTPGGTLAYGSSQTFSATVTSAAGTPTGTITWSSGALTIGTATLPTTSITVNLTMLPQGLSTVTVTYSGDANFSNVVNTATSVTIGKSTPSGSVTTTPAGPVAFGAPLTLVANFATPAAGTLTGAVNFLDGATTLNPAPVAISSGAASFTLTSPLSPGSHSITATIAADTNFNTFTTAALPLTVGAAGTTTVLGLSTASPSVGATVTFNVTVTPAANAPANPTGSVAIRDANTDTLLCSITLPATSCNVVYSGTPVETAPGAHNVKAVYTSNAATTWADSVSSVKSLTVGASASSISTPTSSAGASYNYAGTTTFTAVVSPHPGAPNFTGTVQFFDGNTAVGAPIVPNVATGSVTSAPILLAAGTHTITAQFAGDTNYGASPVSANLIVTVNKATPTFTVTGSTFTATYGGTLSAGTVTVNTTAGGVAPTGSVTLTSGVSNFSGTFNVAGGVATVTGAQLPTSLAPGAGQVLTFNYSGDSNYAAANTTGAITVTQATPTLSLASSQNPSSLNQSVTFTATIATPTTGTPTGTITFKDNGGAMASCPSAVAIVSGAAQCTTTALTAAPPATHSITAVYSGDTNFATNTSAAVNQQVNAGSTTITVTPSSLTPALNDVVIYSVVATGGTTPPQGSVVINDGATGVCNIGALTVGAASSTGSCPVTYNGVAPNGAGAHSITAAFTPQDANWSAATSAAVTVNVGKGTPQISNITVTPSVASTCPAQAPTICVPYGTTFGFSVSMTPANPAAIYQQPIRFADGATVLGTPAIGVPSGIASISNILLSGGTHTIKASYPGDSNWNAVDPPVTIIVSGTPLPAANFTISANPINATYGGNLPAVTVNLTSPGGGMAIPTGTVTVTVVQPSGTYTVGTFPLLAGVATLTGTPLAAAFSALNGATQTLTTTYNGDSNYTAGNITSNIILAKANPTINLGSTSNPSTFNQNVTFTVTASNAVGQPTGNVNILDGATVITATPIILANGTGTYTTQTLATGAHNITAAYLGDANFNAFTTTPALVQTVNAAATSITLTPSSTTPALNSQVTYSFTVSGGSSSPQGMVTISDSITGASVALGECSNVTVIAAAPPLTTSSASCIVNYDNSNAQHGSGSHQLVARFTSADTNNWASVSSATKTVTVGKATTSIAQPTSSAGNTFTYGSNTTFSATVTPTTANPNFAVNTVQFYDNGTPLGAPQTPSSTTGIATFTTTTPLLAGNHTITAQFIGDANYLASTVSPNLVVTVSKATPNPVTLTSPAPAYVTTYGGLLTTGVTNVPLVGTGVTPTGTVTLSSGGIAIATGTLDGSGNFTFTNVQMPSAINFGAGQNLTVTYNGDSNYTTATFVSANGLTVNAATSTAVVTSAPISPVSYGQNVTFRVTLSGPGNPATGTISFTADGNAINATCTSPAAVVTANVATCTVAATTANNLGAGSHIITVTNFAEANGNHVLGAVTQLNPFVVGPPAPQIVITSNQNPSVYGQSVTFTATVSGPTGAPAPAGQLQFFDGNGTIGGLQTIATSAANVVTYTLTVPSGSLPTLTGGTHAISATYVALTPGNTADPNYSNGTSQTQTPPSVLQQVVNRAPSQTVNNAAAVPVVASVNIVPASSVYGQAVTLTVDVIPNTGNVGTPTGIVIFKADGIQFGAAVPLQAVGLIQRAQLANFTGLSRGAHGITAEYQGDTNFNASQTASTPFTVDYDNTKTIMSTLPASPTFGAQITLTAQVCGLVAGSATLCNGALAVGPSSTITFFDGSTPLGTTGPVDATGTGSITIVMQNPPFTNAPGGGSPIGTHVITARYNGHGSPSGDDSNFNQSTSAAQNLVIGKALTNSSVASNANPAVTGQTIRFTALVSAPGSFGTSPSGTVQFVDGAAIIGSAPVTTNGGVSSAILDVPSTGVLALSVGQHVISVQYSGDSTYAASNSPLVAPTALVQVVNKAATTTTISSSANASNVGQQVTLTAAVTVNAPGTGVPSGSVQFINLSAPNQPTVLGTSPLVTTPGPGGSNIFMATLVLNNLPQGNPSIVATYSGDTGYLTSTSAPMIQSVAKTPVNITLTSSKSPSILGDQVTFAITVSALPPGTGTPTGIVTVFDGTDQIGQFTLQGGQYNFVTTSLAVGNHAIGVQYGGDPNFQPFNSPTILQIVSKIPTSLAMTSNSPTAIASQIVTFTAVLSPNPIPGVTFASGQVGFYDGANLMGVTNLQSNVATINVANLTVGLHQISAVYIGDDRWSGASSGFYAQTVTLASTSTAIVSSANPAVYGQPITYTMTVQVPFPGTVPALGQVQLYDNNNAIGDPISSANGQFSVTIPLFAPGQHSIVARFIGNGSFSASQSATLPQVVNKAPTVTTLAVQPNGSTSKQQVSMTAVVTVPAPSLFGLPTAPPLNANLPTGTVQFVDTTFNKVLGTAPIALVGGVYTATLTTDQLVQSGSPQVLTATYAGDGYFASSTSGPIGQSVFGTQISAVNGAGYTGSNFAPDSWVTIFGDNLSSGQVTAVTTPYPTSLAGTTVSLVDANGTTKLLPLYFVSAGQINALIPTNTAFGLATLTVTNPQGATASTIILVTRTAPGIFSSNASGIGVAAALIQRVRSDNSQAIENVATYDAASNRMVPLAITAGNDSLYLQLYGTGLRYTPTLSKVTCTIGGKDAPVLYASAAPGFYGLDQVNVQVPAGLTGTVNVVVTVDGQAANTVSLTFK